MACAPALREPTCRLERSAHVVATVDEKSRDSVEYRCVTQKLFFLEKGRVPPVVGDDTRKSQAKFRVVKTRIWHMPRRQRHMRFFPRAPFASSALTDVAFGIEEQRRISLDERHVPMSRVRHQQSAATRAEICVPLRLLPSRPRGAMSSSRVREPVLRLALGTSERRLTRASCPTTCRVPSSALCAGARVGAQCLR